MTEDELRERMRRADPAGSLRPLPPEAARRLVADATTAPLEIPAPRPPLYRRMPVLVGAGALVLVAAGVVALTARTGAEPGPGWDPVVALPTTSAEPGRTSAPGQPGSGTSSPRATTGTPHSGQGTATATPGPTGTPPTSPKEPGGGKVTVNVLTDGEQNSGGRCPKPEAAYLAAHAQLAFEGTVLRIEGRKVTLQVRRTWTGAETDLAEVTHDGTATSGVLAGFAPAAGQTFLLAAANRVVLGCGYSGPAEQELRALYDKAFPRR